MVVAPALVVVTGAVVVVAGGGVVLVSVKFKKILIENPELVVAESLENNTLNV